MGINPGTRESPMARRLQRHGHKLTRARLAVVEVLEAGPHHMSPSEIHERAKEVYPPLGLTTVYRTLDLLTELGVLRTTYMGDASQRFHCTTDGHHDHLVCRVCGTVAEIQECYLESVVETIQHATGFQVDGHFLELYGKCPNCQAGP